MRESRHTPTPWRKRPATASFPATAVYGPAGYIGSFRGKRHAEDAKIAVLAVNAHDELVAGLAELAAVLERAAVLHPSRDMREIIGDPGGLAFRARALIAKAIGGAP